MSFIKDGLVLNYFPWLRQLEPRKPLPRRSAYRVHVSAGWGDRDSSCRDDRQRSGRMMQAEAA